MPLAFHPATSAIDVESVELSLSTPDQASVIDLTAECTQFVAGRADGLLSVFVPHATAGVAIIEVGAGSDRDLFSAIEDLLPAQIGRWSHDHGTPGHGRDHVLPALVSPSVTIPVVDGRMTLGTWQSVVLVDTNIDNPHRRVRLSHLAP